MAQDLGGIVGTIFGNPNAARRRAESAIGDLVQDALTPDTLKSELAEERQEQRRNRSNTLTEQEMQGLLRLAERTNTTLDIQPQQDGTYRFTINGEETTRPLRVDDEAITLAQQSPLVRMTASASAKQMTAMERSPSDAVASVFLNMLELQSQGEAQAAANARTMLLDVQRVVGDDGWLQIEKPIRLRVGDQEINVQPGNYSAEPLLRTMGDQIGISDELREQTRKAAEQLHKEGLLTHYTPLLKEPAPASPAVTTPAPRIEVDPTVFQGNDGVTGGTPSATTQASTSKAPASTIAAPMDGPSAPPPIDSDLAGSPSYQQQVAARTQEKPAAVATAMYSQDELTQIGQLVTGATGAKATAVETMLGKNADGDGQLSEKEATAALNKMQLLNFSPEGRAQLAELAKALQGQGVSGGDTIAGGESRSPNAGVGTQVTQRDTGINFA